MITTDHIVFDDRTHYVANFTEDGWFRWPAIQGGWAKRTRCPATSADDLLELPDGELALRLSGWTP